MTDRPGELSDPGLADAAWSQTDGYRRLVEDSLGLICAHDLDGKLLFVNDSAARVLGYTPEHGIGRNIIEFLAPGTRDLFGDYLGRIREHRIDEGLMRVVDKYGQERVWMYRNVRSEKHGERPYVVGHAIDITDRVSIERSLRTSAQAVKRASAELESRIEEQTDELRAVNDRLRTKIAEHMRERSESNLSVREDESIELITDAAPVLLWMSDPHQQRTYFNRAWLEFTGRSKEADLGVGWTAAVHPDDLTPYLSTATQAFDQRDSFRTLYRLRRHDGEFRWVLDAGVPRTTPAGAFAGYLGSCIDITEHKRSQDVLAALSRRLMEAQESERSSIARELHEDLAQRTVALAWQMSRLAGALPSDAAERVLLQEMCGQATALGQDLQSISLRLHSFKLDYLGIAAAVTGFCMELSKQHGIDIDVDHDGVPESVPKDIALALFRVLQEALINAVRHSGSRQIQVVLRGNPAEIQLAVIDHGIGFDPEAAMRRQALGLVAMQERLNLVGGQIIIESRPGAGTAVRVRVPFKSTPETHKPSD